MADLLPLTIKSFETVILDSDIAASDITIERFGKLVIPVGRSATKSGRMLVHGILENHGTINEATAHIDDSRSTFVCTAGSTLVNTGDIVFNNAPATKRDVFLGGDNYGDGTFTNASRYKALKKFSFSFRSVEI